MVSVPIIEGPITGPGAPFLINTSSDQALAAAAYEAKEYFVSGTATSYRSVNDEPANGMWEVEPAESAAYKTRILVYRPVDAAKFNGTVVMEWFNVSGGLEAGPDWTLMHNELLRRGYVWIGVSAQCGGVEGSAATSLGLVKMDLKTVDAKRYGSLSHPGDDYSYDIYSQVARVIRKPGRVNPLTGCRLERILAVGQSQSAIQLTAYINAIQPSVKLFDGFLLHGRPCSASLGGFSSAESDLSEIKEIDLSGMAPVFIRTDINVPVLILESETDVMILGYYMARQDDTDKIRLWEMAGTAHADLYVVVTDTQDTGNDPSVANVVEVTSPYPGIIECPVPINAGPQHFIAKAAIHQLDKWVRTRVPPKPAPRLEITDNHPEFVLDAFGNAKGGIRTPYVDVPIAKLSGLGQPAVPIITSLFGTTKLFDRAILSRLYSDHHTYVTAAERSTDAAVQAGFLMPEDGELIKAAAAASNIGNPRRQRLTSYAKNERSGSRDDLHSRREHLSHNRCEGRTTEVLLAFPLACDRVEILPEPGAFHKLPALPGDFICKIPTSMSPEALRYEPVRVDPSGPPPQIAMIGRSEVAAILGQGGNRVGQPKLIGVCQVSD